MPYIGNSQVAGSNTNNFKVLDDITSYTETFDGTSASIVNTTNNTIRVPKHRFYQGQRVTYNNGGGANIGGLTSGTTYFVSFDTNETIKLATSLSNANSNQVVNISSVAGSGTSHTLNNSFDGVNSKFKITHSGGNEVSLEDASQLTVAINNVLQRPSLNDGSFVEGFTVVDRKHIKFKNAPLSSDVFWGHVIAEIHNNFDPVDFKIDTFTGDGTTTQFNLSRIPPNNTSVLVTLDGVVQHPNDTDGVKAYNISSNGILFSSAPAFGVDNFAFQSPISFDFVLTF